MTFDKVDKQKGDSMNSLVFLEPDNIKAIPFTTSDVIAEHAQINYRSVQRMIEKHIKRLEKFGRVRFEMTPFETKGGMQNKKIYHLDEQQATLLITYLKNTEPVMDFKDNLVKQFYLMREELTKRKVYREQLKPIRRELTDVIQDNPEHGKWDFKMYTDLAYKAALGQCAAQLRKARGAGKQAKAIDYMGAGEIVKVTKIQSQISVLLDMGMDYHQIKELLFSKCRSEVIT